jgi:hypothetical protein
MRAPPPQVREPEVQRVRHLVLAALTLQSHNAKYHVLSCTLSAVRALYVVEYTFYDGFKSHYPNRHAGAGPPDQNLFAGLSCGGSSKIWRSFLAQYTRSRFAPLTSFTMPCFSS